MSSTGMKAGVRTALGDSNYAKLARYRRQATQRGRDLVASLARPYDITFFCEQPGHWQNVELVVRSLRALEPRIRMKMVVAYSASDYPEAAYPSFLRVDFGLPHSSLPSIKTHILYTPFSGIDSSSKPEHSTVVHALHSLTGLDGVYPHSMFDHYDYILCTGAHQIEDFERWGATNSKLKGKVLIPAGYPKLDLMIQATGQFPKTEATGDSITVVYAPTLGSEVNGLASLLSHGEQIVDSLLAEDYCVIFRPHPLSLADPGKVLIEGNDADRETIERISKKHSSNKRFTLDRSNSYLETYAKANVMVTDVSGTGFTFSLAFLRPSIFFAPNVQAEEGLRGIHFEDRHEIGGVVRSTQELTEMIHEFRNNPFADRLAAYRRRTLFNVGSSSTYIAGSLLSLLAGQAAEEWVRI